MPVAVSLTTSRLPRMVSYLNCIVTDYDSVKVVNNRLCIDAGFVKSAMLVATLLLTALSLIRISVAVYCVVIYLQHHRTRYRN